MYRDILLAYDGSPASREALTQCRSLAINGRANIHLVAVVGPELYQFPVDGMTVHLNHSRQEITADLRKGQAELRHVRPGTQYSTGTLCPLEACGGR